jgi:hypothetical protein
MNDDCDYSLDTTVKYTLGISGIESRMLWWYIKHKDIRNTEGRLINVNSAMESMVKSFIQDTIQPMYFSHAGSAKTNTNDD